MTGSYSGQLGSLLESARRKLLETGTRNRLIHVNRNNPRANCLNIINERSDDVFGILRTQGRRMRFRAMGQDQRGQADDTRLLAVDRSNESFDEGRYVDQYLETPLGPDAQQKRLLRLALDARTAEEEQGVNILYLVLGFLTWLEDQSSSVKREAPLILVPAELIRNERTSTYDIRCRDDDITTNLPLQERLKQDFGIVLPEIDEGEGWSPSEYFAQVGNVIAERTGWRIEPDAVQLGFFSFAKLLMLRDLDPQNWPEGALTESDLIRGLLVDGFTPADDLFGPEDRLDQILDPADIIQVVDADASQTKVIEEVRRGRNLMVQGPPGTGKSQTITNIIAAAVHDGKSVLFMAEKMAALSVVHHRMVSTGLRDVCVELHSRKANKKALAQELGRTLAAGRHRPTISADPTKLRATRDALNRIADLQHTVLDGKDYTPFQAVAEIVRFIGCDAPPPSLVLEGLQCLTNEDLRRIRDNIGRYVKELEASGHQDDHPFTGTKALDLQPPDLQRLGQELSDAISALDTLTGRASDALGVLGTAEPESLDDVSSCQRTLSVMAGAPEGAADYISVFFDCADENRLVEALEAGVDWKTAKVALEPVFHDNAWGAPVEPLRLAVARGLESFFARLGRRYRRAASELGFLLRADLPKQASKRLALIEKLIDVQRKYALLAEDQPWLETILADLWRGERTDYGRALRAAKWLIDVRVSGVIRTSEMLSCAFEEFQDPEAVATEFAGLVEQAHDATEKPVERLSYDLSGVALGSAIGAASISALSDQFAQMRDHLHRYDEWVRLENYRTVLRKDGLAPLINAIAKGILAPGRAEEEFAYACAEARWRHARDCHPTLSEELRTLNRHELVKVFGGLEKDRFRDVQALVLSRHFEQLPRGSAGEMGIIRGEIARKRGHKSIRWVIKHAGTMVQRVKPVFLMSPISVAQFLSPGSVNFDLLVIDEASQVRPEDALGAVARARQIVVVGDQKQLPPTSFFDRLTGEQNDDEGDEAEALGAKATEMESILTLCEARGLRQNMLEWHYRSRDPSLIRVSNAEFYGDKLVLPPSPLQLDPNYGLKFKHVKGAYSSKSKGGGRPGTNKIEAQEIVTTMAKHARDWPSLSLGTVTFSKAQSDMVTEVLEHARRQDSVLDDFLRENKSENFFVKNIENVQGDERDVILISVGYGPHEPGERLSSMTFGPINAEGGERRLNVLFSRARVRCEVFASFDPGDIDLARTSREGPRVLKRFLEFAKSGLLDQRLPTGLDAESPFEEDVGQVIERLGYEVDAQVGSGGFRIDLGVRHAERPGQYILAVECDGATYHSALWARQRDRLRQEVLEGLGWRFHRIWSTDWFYRRQQEIGRLRAALEVAREDSLSGITVRGANDGMVDFVSDATTDEPAPDPVEIAATQITIPTYQKAELSVRSNLEPHEAPLHQLSDLVEKVVEIEGPIHVEEVARRISIAFGKARTGNRIVNATRSALAHAARRTQGRIRRDGEYWLTDAQDENPPVRDRSNESGTLVKASAIPPMEIRAAAALIEKESGQVDVEELVRAVARLMGFQRVGPDLQEAIRQCLRA